MSTTVKQEMSFEDSMQKLEHIVQQLEMGQMPLEDALKAFEEGAGLIKNCSTVLKDAELRIVKLTSQEKTTE